MPRGKLKLALRLIHRAGSRIYALVRGLKAVTLRFLLAPGRALRRRIFFGTVTRRQGVTLFLAPEAGLAPFFASHLLLARTLADAGHAVLLLSCDGLQPMCSVKFAMQVPATSPSSIVNRACIQCRAIAVRAGHHYRVPDVSLEHLLDASARKEIEQIVAAKPDAPWEITYDGIEFGAACLGETLRAQRKTSTAELSEEDTKLLNALLYSSLAIYIGLTVLAKRFEIQRIVYFGDYAYFIPPQLFAKRRSIPVTHVSHAYNQDIDRRKIVLWPGHGVTQMLSQVDRWSSVRDQPITPDLVAAIAEGSLFRLRGHGGASTYSPNWSDDRANVLDDLALPKGGKLIVAYSNSTDELVCNRQFMQVLGLPKFEDAPNPFPTQIAWLQALVDWVAQRDSLRLVVRLHPRMAVSHRHTTVASEYAQIKAAFASLPRNVAFVPPESDLSSYNLAELADVALTAWSSIGLELARFGIPVIAAFQKIGPFPKSSFIQFEETREGYLQAIERALAQPASFERITGAFRWTHFLHWTSLIDVSDVTPTADYPDVPRYHPPRNREIILDVLTKNQDLVATNMARLPGGVAASHGERLALIRALEKFVFYFMTGELRDLSSLSVAEYGMRTGSRTDTPDAKYTLEIRDGGEVALSGPNGVRERHSPLVARLARVLAESSALAEN